ncbi:MAG: vWA domain-containing protein [Kofleriaceae bacterium]
MRTIFVRLAMLPLALALLAGCPDRTISEVNPEQGRVEYKNIPVTVNRDIDILFVIDNSKSMEDKQENLVANFPDFINVLQTIPGGLPNVHIGVVTTDMGAKATRDPTPATGVSGCTGSGEDGRLRTHPSISGSFISDIDPGTGVRSKNYSGDLATVFRQLAKVGDTGCGFEQHLESMKRALTNPANNGFVRRDAYLAVIFIADEDDCSMARTAMLGPESAALGTLQSFRCTRFGVTCDQNGSTTDAMKQVGSKGQCHPNDSSPYLETVQSYVDFLKGLKADPKLLIVAGVLGTTEPFQVELRAPLGQTAVEPALAHSCSYTGSRGLEVADPPIRLKYFLDQFPDRSTFTTICQRNLADALEKIAGLLRIIIGDPCMQGLPADVDPQTPGPQYDCVVSDLQKPGTAEAVETVIPACNASLLNKPCWHIAVDADRCPADDQLALKIERAVDPPADTHIIANCVTEAN